MWSIFRNKSGAWRCVLMCFSAADYQWEGMLTPLYTDQTWHHSGFSVSSMFAFLNQSETTLPVSRADVDDWSWTYEDQSAWRNSKSLWKSNLIIAPSTLHLGFATLKLLPLRRWCLIQLYTIRFLTRTNVAQIIFDPDRATSLRYVGAF